MTSIFPELLRARRERFNALFAEARQRYPQLDAEIFGDWLKESVAPLVEVAPATAAADVLETLYVLSLDSLGRELIGPAARFPAMTRVWQDILPAAAAALAESPEVVTRSLCNAANRLQQAGARCDDWLVIVGLNAAGLAAGTLLGFARLAAWRCGLATEREQALVVMQSLPPALVKGALDLPQAPEDPARLAALLAADPWLAPAPPTPRRGELALVGRVGAFRGFGGVFAAPPTVRSEAARLIAVDGETEWLVVADVYGAMLVRAGEGGSAAAATKPALSAGVAPDGLAIIGSRRKLFRELQRPTSCACDGRTLAVTVSWSHAVHLVAEV